MIAAIQSQLNIAHVRCRKSPFGISNCKIGCGNKSHSMINSCTLWTRWKNMLCHYENAKLSKNRRKTTTRNWASRKAHFARTYWTTSKDSHGTMFKNRNGCDGGGVGNGVWCSCAVYASFHSVSWKVDIWRVTASAKKAVQNREHLTVCRSYADRTWNRHTDTSTNQQSPKMCRK